MNPPCEKVFSQFPDLLPAEPCRLFHGRGQTVPEYEFLTIDWYPPLVLITLYENRDDTWINQLAEKLWQLSPQPEAVAVQFRGESRDGSCLVGGTLPDPLIIREHSLRYRLDPLAEQNIGFFPDMKPGRRLVQKIAEGKKMLNLFAYTCAFSVAAIAGGARQVVNLDMNRNLLERGRENHLLNDHDLRKVSFLPYDLFKSFGRLRQLGPFDLIVIDPPYRQGGNFKAERDWPKMIRRLPELLAPAGEIIAAVSAPELGRSFLRQQFRTNLPAVTLLTELTADSDFPEADPDRGLHLQHYRLENA